jgi:hypothetical protein
LFQYKRALAYPYSIPYFQADLTNAALLHVRNHMGGVTFLILRPSKTIANTCVSQQPKFLDIGGNLGTTNTFTGVDVANLTGGVFNAAGLLQGNNAACLAYQFAAQAKPDVALSVFNVVNQDLGSVLSQLGCPQLQDIDDEQLMMFPGYQKSTQAGITK